MKLRVRGINDGLLMSLPEASWDECCAAVLETVGENEPFYAGANLFLDAGQLDIRVVEITALRNELENRGIFLKGIFGQSEKTNQNCRSLGMMTAPVFSARNLRKEKIEEVQQAKEIGEPAYLVIRTVRSGNVIEKKETIVVLGDINPGAEVISDKNVIVLGTIRGRVTAGGSREAGAFISAGGFDNAQVMVNGVLALIGKESYDKPSSGMLMVRNIYGEIKIDTK